jgi:hypothetical protein
LRTKKAGRNTDRLFHDALLGVAAGSSSVPQWRLLLALLRLAVIQIALQLLDRLYRIDVNVGAVPHRVAPGRGAFAGSHGICIAIKVEISEVRFGS